MSFNPGAQMIEPVPGEGRGAAPSTNEVTSAFDQLYAEHFAFVWRSLRRLGVSEASIDDAAQETFLVVHRHLPTLQLKHSMKAWLSGVVTRVASDFRRAARRKDPVVRSNGNTIDADQLDAGPRGNPHKALEAADARRLLHEVLDELEWPKREAFVLVELEEMSVPEVAHALGVNENTVSSRVRAARQSFNQAVARRMAHERWRTG